LSGEEKKTRFFYIDLTRWPKTSLKWFYLWYMSAKT